MMRIGVTETNCDLVRISHVSPQEAGTQVTAAFDRGCRVPVGDC
jgi:hypothetical protein